MALYFVWIPTILVFQNDNGNKFLHCVCRLLWLTNSIENCDRIKLYIHSTTFNTIVTDLTIKLSNKCSKFAAIECSYVELLLFKNND